MNNSFSLVSISNDINNLVKKITELVDNIDKSIINYHPLMYNDIDKTLKNIYNILLKSKNKPILSDDVILLMEHIDFLITCLTTYSVHKIISIKQSNLNILNDALDMYKKYRTIVIDNINKIDNSRMLLFSQICNGLAAEISIKNKLMDLDDVKYYVLSNTFKIMKHTQYKLPFLNYIISHGTFPSDENVDTCKNYKCINNTLTNATRTVTYDINKLLHGPSMNISKKSGIYTKMITDMSYVVFRDILKVNKTKPNKYVNKSTNITLLETTDNGKTYKKLITRDKSAFDEQTIESMIRAPPQYIEMYREHESNILNNIKYLPEVEPKEIPLLNIKLNDIKPQYEIEADDFSVENQSMRERNICSILHTIESENRHRKRITEPLSLYKIELISISNIL